MNRRDATALAAATLLGLAVALPLLAWVWPGLVPRPIAVALGLGVPSPAQLGLPEPEASFAERSHVRVRAAVDDRSGSPYTGEVWLEIAQSQGLGRATAGERVHVASGRLDARLDAFRVEASTPVEVAIWRGSSGASPRSVFASDADGHGCLRVCQVTLRHGVHVLELGRCILAAPPLIGTVALTSDMPSNDGHLVFLPRAAAADEVASTGSRIDVAPGSTLHVYSWSTSDLWSMIGVVGGVRSGVVEFARGSHATVHVASFATLAGTLDTQAFPGRAMLVFVEADGWTPFEPTRAAGMPRYWEARRRAAEHPQGQAFEDGTFQSGRLAPHTRYVVELWTSASMQAGAPVHTTTLTTNGGATTGVHIAAP